MSNITLAIDGDLLQKSRSVAQKNGTSLNEMIRGFLADVTADGQGGWYSHYHAVAHQIQGDSQGWQFDREELHER
ncbi:MAG: hypothetical protein LBL86_01575 [Coriobacteriales bacterium]|nr:hypothetical protein [Coriobacteriales bacterium]